MTSDEPEYSAHHHISIYFIHESDRAMSLPAKLSFLLELMLPFSATVGRAVIIASSALLATALRFTVCIGFDLISLVRHSCTRYRRSHSSMFTQRVPVNDLYRSSFDVCDVGDLN